MKMVTALESPAAADRPRIFMAGGITNCPDWQTELAGRIDRGVGTLFNPRRAHFPIDDPSAADEQIRWEHDALRLADGILFWFPAETLCPIVLYELGAWSMTTKPLVVGCHPDYRRREDVFIQTELARPDVPLRDSLEDVAWEVGLMVTRLRDWDPQ